MSFLIQKYKSTTMLRIQDCISRGYYHHTRGLCKPEKIIQMVAKFDELYQINLNRDQRTYRKKKAWCFQNRLPLQISTNLL